MQWFAPCALFLPALLCPLRAGEWESKGEITVESRVFSDDDREETQDAGLGLFSRLEAGYEYGPLRLHVRGFARVDREDDSRDLAAIEEAWLDYKQGAWQVRLGFELLNWTATEAFHPADIINSRNLDSNIENPEKLGELMLSVRRKINNGGLTLYYMPRFEPPVLAEPSSRLSFVPAGLTLGDARAVDRDGRFAADHWVDQWGLHFTQTVGDVDFGFFYLEHLDRQQPQFEITQAGEFRPVYSFVKDTGLTYLHILGDWIFKLEAAHKDFSARETGPSRADHGQVAFGLDYGWANSDGSETTVIFEGQGLFGVDEAERAALGVFQRDLLLGCRHAWNDAAGRELLVTAIADVERSHEYLLNLSYRQRLSDTWSIHTGLRLIDAPAKGPIPRGLEGLDESNQVFLNFSRYF